MEPDKKTKKAINNAYALLRQRPRSEYEIRSRLKLKGYGSDVVSEVIAGLIKSGEIDDARFAWLWVEERMRLNPAGDVVLRHELKVKGLPEAVIDATLAKKAVEYDEYGIALNMARERFEQLKKLDRPKAIKRLYDLLVRRGFKYDTVQRIVDKILNAN
ncbi:MAG: regulatory protein RecX [Candidatus Omnitrophica bacterium]|nr:regulatory protein RecX [Candidatus Omnitrophota bacterium]